MTNSKIAKVDEKRQRPDAPGGTQSIQRATQILRLIASRNRTGMRLVDAVQHSGLVRPTVHRILKCLISEGLVTQDSLSHRYFLGHLIFELGLAAAPQFNLVDICRPSMQRIAEKTKDTVFLTVRSGYDTVCLDRLEGDFPIKTLTLEVGTRRPLGVGAGGLALLMPLLNEEVDKILSANGVRLMAYNNLNVPSLLKILARSRKLGYALNDIHVTPGAISLGLPVINFISAPIIAISIGAIKSRMTDERQKELVAILNTEVRLLEKLMTKATDLD